MDLATLARELRLIAERGGGFGSEVELALGELAKALQLRPNWGIDELEKALKPKTSRVKKVVAFDSVTQGLIDEYVLQLEQSVPAGEALRVLHAIEKDRRIKRDEFYAVARKFLGADLTFKKRADAEAEVRDRITRRDWDKASIKVISERAKS